MGLGIPMMKSLAEFDPRRLADDLRRTWQARALVETQRTQLGGVVLSMLAHSYDDVMPTLMRVVFPGFQGIRPPFLCSAGKINKRGHVIADVVMRDNQPPRKNRIIYRSLTELRDDFRHLADSLKLDDRDRIDMFNCLQRWIVADQRLDPTMNPADPDARRLTVH